MGNVGLYNPDIGALGLDIPVGAELTFINIHSAAGIFTGESAQNLGNLLDIDSDHTISKVVSGFGIGSLSFGNVAQLGLSNQFVAEDLTVTGTINDGRALVDVDCCMLAEPSGALMLFLGLAFAGFKGLKQRRH